MPFVASLFQGDDALPELIRLVDSPIQCDKVYSFGYNSTIIHGLYVLDYSWPDGSTLDSSNLLVVKLDGDNFDQGSGRAVVCCHSEMIVFDSKICSISLLMMDSKALNKLDNISSISSKLLVWFL